MNMYAVFGMSYSGKWFINEVGAKAVRCIIDNNSDLWGTYWRGIPVMSLNDFLGLNEDVCIIIASTRHYNEIVTQLRDVNVMNIISITRAWADIKLEQKNKQRIFLMNTHSYTNGGDYFITLSEKKYLQNYFPEYEAVIIPSMVCIGSVGELKPYINENDLILISGGGYLGNLWMENGEENVRSIIMAYPKNPIIILPQSMYFTNDLDGDEQRRETSKIYNQHQRLTVCLREKRSFEEAKALLGSRSILFIPDITFQYENIVNPDRKGIGLCIRSDKESCLDDEDRVLLRKILDARTDNIGIIAMEVKELLSEEEAETEVLDKIKKISDYELVITDRLHCMMMCYVTDTPCIAFDNLSSKISGTYDFIKKSSSIRIVRNVTEIDPAIDTMVSDAHFNSECCNGVKERFNELTNLIRKYLGN